MLMLGMRSHSLSWARRAPWAARAWAMARSIIMILLGGDVSLHNHDTSGPSSAIEARPARFDRARGASAAGADRADGVAGGAGLPHDRDRAPLASRSSPPRIAIEPPSIAIEPSWIAPVAHCYTTRRRNVRSSYAPPFDKLRARRPGICCLLFASFASFAV
jgi:hypothetical protein